MNKMWRTLVVVAAAGLMLAGLSGTASASKPEAPRGLVLQAQTSRLVIISQGGGPLLLDAHEISSMDFQVVTRPPQNDNTQKWWLTNVGGGLYTLVQASSGRYLDAHEIAELDYRVVTRPQQNNDTQLWRLQDYGGAFYTIQQASSGRYLDAYQSPAQDFRAVTRPWSGANSQVWRIVGA
ncbi:RICIN domain-containing protein [Dactylosporangium sp. CA-233914]|uniref:RICIN domain-containing protein n=1 Tax=Dactylosporangium sp. CA-233914 TaxID=3239934 RepID=UPI003D90C67D